MAADLHEMTNPSRPRTLMGTTLQVQANGSPLQINNAQIVAVDQKASNGVIHRIDTVLMPPAP